jgi:hypothetical protein
VNEATLFYDNSLTSLDLASENVIVVGGNDSGLDRHLAAVATRLQP